MVKVDPQDLLAPMEQKAHLDQLDLLDLMVALVNWDPLVNQAQLGNKVLKDHKENEAHLAKMVKLEALDREAPLEMQVPQEKEDPQVLLEPRVNLEYQDQLDLEDLSASRVHLVYRAQPENQAEMVNLADLVMLEASDDLVLLGNGVSPAHEEHLVQQETLVYPEELDLKAQQAHGVDQETLVSKETSAPPAPLDHLVSEDLQVNLGTRENPENLAHLDLMVHKGDQANRVTVVLQVVLVKLVHPLIRDYLVMQEAPAQLDNLVAQDQEETLDHRESKASLAKVALPGLQERRENQDLLDPRENKVKLVQLASLDGQEELVMLGSQVDVEPTEIKVFRASPVTLAQKADLDLKGYPAHKARVDPLDPRGVQELRDHLEILADPGVPAAMEPLAQLAYLVAKDQEEMMVFLALKDLWDHPDLKVNVVTLVSQV